MFKIYNKKEKNVNKWIRPKSEVKPPKAASRAKKFATPRSGGADFLCPASAIASETMQFSCASFCAWFQRFCVFRRRRSLLAADFHSIVCRSSSRTFFILTTFLYLVPLIN